MYSRFTVFFTNVLIFMIIAQVSLAQEHKPGKQADQLEEVVVSAGRIEEKKKEIIANVTVIDKDTIDTSPAKDLGELLTEKGVGYSKKYPGASNVVGIRGFRTDTFGDEIQGHVLIMVNGRRAGTGNAAKIMTKNIERIEIIRGPASVQYGSAAMGGVINVITKQGRADTEIFAEAGMGSHGYDEGSVGFSGTVRQFDYAVSATASKMDDYRTAEGDVYLNTGYDKKTDLNINAGFTFLNNHRVGFLYSKFEAKEVGLPDYFSRQDLDDYKDSALDSYEINYDGATANKKYSWKLRYFNTIDTEENTDPVASDPSGYDDGIVTESEDDQKGGQGQISVNLGNSVITLGGDWTHYDIEGDYAPFQSEYDNLAFFLFGKMSLINKRLILSGGIRYDLFDVEIIDPAGNNESTDNLSTRMGAAFMLTDNLKIRGGFGEAFAFPSAKELAYDYVSHSMHYVGNPDLNPEKSRTYEAGFDYSLNAVNASLTYFYTDFKDKIESKPDETSDIITWKNLGEAELEGLEGSFSMDIGFFFDLAYEIRPYANFTYMIKYSDEQTQNDLLETSDWNASYGISVSDYDTLSATLNFAYTGSMRITDYEGGWPYQEVSVDAFTVADLTVKKQLMELGNAGKLSIKGEIRNIFEETYSYAKGYPMPGRNFFIGLRYDY